MRSRSLEKYGAAFNPQHLLRQRAALSTSASHNRTPLSIRRAVLPATQTYTVPQPSTQPKACRRYFFFESLCFLMPTFRNLMAFFGPPVALILNFFPRCLL